MRASRGVGGWVGGGAGGSGERGIKERRVVYAGGSSDCRVREE